jgi:hypothetical protein
MGKGVSKSDSKKVIGYYVPSDCILPNLGVLKDLLVNTKERKESINIGPFLGIG